MFKEVAIICFFADTCCDFPFDRFYNRLYLQYNEFLDVFVESNFVFFLCLQYSIEELQQVHDMFLINMIAATVSYL